MTVSPDGAWLAYTSNRTGRTEVYVRRFPDVEAGFVPVSRDGGSEPVWSSEGRELFYRGPDGSMMAATYSAGSEFTVLDQVRLFDGSSFRANSQRRTYDYSPSRDRFVRAPSTA